MKLNRFFALVFFLLIGIAKIIAQSFSEVSVMQEQFQIPLLKGKENNPFIRLKLVVTGKGEMKLSAFQFNLKGTTSLKDIQQLKLYYFKNDSTENGSLDFSKAQVFGTVNPIYNKVTINGSLLLGQGTHYLWLSCTLAPNTDPLHQADASCTQIRIGDRLLVPSPEGKEIHQKIALALRKHGDDNVNTYRIPGITTSKNGTLLAVYDIRRESSRDLQGHMDIGVSRSLDGGNTWLPMQIAIDMKEWGGLPQKFNGVSDACILSDDKSGAIYIAGLWMHGVLDNNGKWIEGLTDSSKAWNHQWREKGSQPGFDVKQTSQFLIVKSTNEGKTWSDPINLTTMCKKEEWWLWAPAPGHGITLENGTLVFPTQGRDKNGRPFSNITYSNDGGLNWHTSVAADTGSTTECMAVQLSNGDVMLNMRANENRLRKGDDNGRAIATTSDLGNSWNTHKTSRKTLNEPVCMASIHKQNYMVNSKSKSVLVFLNPNTKSARNHLTIKISFDDGKTWPEKYWTLLDEWNGNGYSCITSIDAKTIGVLYEGSGANLVFQKINIKKIIEN
jgi:sialidase-1